jgi:hypothetical protein
MSALSDAVAQADEATARAIEQALAEGARQHKDTAVRLLFGDEGVRVLAVYLPAGSDAASLSRAPGTPWMIYGTSSGAPDEATIRH